MDRLIKSMKTDIDVLNMKIDVLFGKVREAEMARQEANHELADAICDRDERIRAIKIIEGVEYGKINR